MNDLPPGLAFEKEVAEFLRSGGFRTKANSRAAHPRQTDLYAQADGIDLLIEVKDRARKLDISDVDAIRARLRRTAADVVGVIFTKSGLTRGAIKDIESDRTREVLVVREDEIALLRQGRVNLRPLLERKHQELRFNGHAYFGPVATADYKNVQLPRGSYEFRSQGRSRPYFASRTGFAHAAFAMEIPDLGWGNSGGVTLSLRLTLSTGEDLRDIMGCVHETFGLSNKGSFHIRQSDACWQGTGAEELIEAVSSWRTRYSDAACKRLHHSEDISYLDRLRDGWVTLTTRQRVHAGNGLSGRDSYLHDSHLAISLPGIPLDSRPFLDLCRYTGNDWGKFEVVAERNCRNNRLKRRLALKVVGKVVETGSGDGSRVQKDRTVVGVIAKNPFYRKKSLPRELKDAMVPMNDLLAMELLLCDVRDWHDEGDVIDAYMLEGFETTCMPGGQVIRPFGTWNRILRRARTRKEELSRLSAEAEAILQDQE